MFIQFWDGYNMKYFMMSKRFNKTSYEDFGLSFINGKYIKNSDNSEWEPVSLYNFGWGEENGYFKKPLGDFNFLLSLIFYNDEEDAYGAAAIILRKYPYELKEFIFNKVIGNNTFDLESLEKVFNLTNPINRTIKVGMNYETIKKEYEDWVIISKYFIEKL